MKVVHELGLAGFIETIRGRGGGLRLAKQPTEITVGEVVRRMEPDFGLAACFRPDQRCAISRACTLTAVLSEALDSFLAVLDGYTLEDLVSRPRQLAHLLRIEPDPARTRD